MPDVKQIQVNLLLFPGVTQLVPAHAGTREHGV